MKDINKAKLAAKKRRQARVRAKIFGTEKLPRLRVSKSLKHVFLQLIDDCKGRTLTSAHSKQLAAKGKKTEISFKTGELLAQKAMAAGIKRCVFDRGGHIYHGVIRQAAEGARKAGLKF